MRNSFQYNGITITWLNHHAGFLIETAKGRRIYIDPWEVAGADAEIVLVTHPHYDHFNADDIGRIKTPRTTIVGPREIHRQVSGHFVPLEPGKSSHHDGVLIDAVPAYNVNKFKAPGEPFHGKQLRWAGYVISVDGVRIYHAGDTDVIDEMHQIKNIDIALLPCGGTYTMDGAEAADAANLIKPKVAVPMHWGKIVGTRHDAETFQKHFSGETKILE